MASFAGSLVEASFISSGEANDARRSDKQAVDGKWRKRPGLEVPHEEANGQVGRDAADEEAHDDLTVDVSTGGSGKGRQFKNASSKDHGGGQQEAESGRVLMIQSTPQAADDGHT